MKRKIYINENRLPLLCEEKEEVTYYEFFLNAKEFLKGLLKKPVDADVNDFFKKHGISKEDLIKKLKNVGLLKSKENILEVPIEEAKKAKEIKGKLRAKHTLQYLVPRNRFKEKMHELYKQLFSESVFKDEYNMKKAILDSEDGYVYRTRGGIKE